MLGDRIGQPAEPDEADYHDLTDLGKPLGWKATKMNVALVKAGLQTEQRTADGKYHGKWLLTEAGRVHGHAFGRHIAKNNYESRHVKWRNSVVEVLKPFMTV